MTLYESPQVQQWRIEYSELREEFGTELSEFEFVAQKAAGADQLEKIRQAASPLRRGVQYASGLEQRYGLSQALPYVEYPHKQGKEQA
jgi:hypothetical protein